MQLDHKIDSDQLDVICFISSMLGESGHDTTIYQNGTICWQHASCAADDGTAIIFELETNDVRVNYRLPSSTYYAIWGFVVQRDGMTIDEFGSM